ncbi:MAG TPA: restriction endonuclease [Lysobacter sp.]
MIAAVLGGAATAWLWLVQRRQVESAAGLKLLSAMRWREFSKLVTSALRARGFEEEALEDAAERGQQSDLRLQREGRIWLLACKQGGNHKVTPATVAEMIDTIRFHGAAGGLIATTGTVEATARKTAAGNIQLIDGAALWPLVQPQLAHSVRDELYHQSRSAALRTIVLAWIAALVVGLGVAWVLPESDSVDEVAPAAAPAAPANSAPGPSEPAATLAPAPVSEDEQRNEVIRVVATLPGVERVLWPTRSTLMVYLVDETADPVDRICAVLEGFDNLRTSRVHLQPPPGSTRPARFLQCRTF